MSYNMSFWLHGHKSDIIINTDNDMFYEKNSNNNQSENETDITDISGTGLVPTHM